jgi:hypothetical protein
MNKKTRSIVVLIAFAAGSLVTFASSPASPVEADAVTPTPGLFKLIATESEGTPQGCIQGCPTVKTNIPTFSDQTVVGAAIATATEIDTFTANAWDQATQQNKSYEGGCAILAGGLQCWGNNTYGQLGDETTTSSPTTPVIAKENGNAFTKISDVATNGLTTCIVVDGVLKCVGSGNWEGNYSERYNIWSNLNTCQPTSGGMNCVGGNGTSQQRLKIYNPSNEVISDTGAVPSSSALFISMASKNWVTFPSLGSDVKKVVIGANTNNSSTPTICVLKTTGSVACASVTAGTDTQPDSLQTREIKYDCVDAALAPYTNTTNFDGDYESTTRCNEPGYFKQRDLNTSATRTSSATWKWSDASVTGATDLAMYSDGWAMTSICTAGTATVCQKFSSGLFSSKIEVENGENSQAVYMTSGFGPPGICLYSNNTVSCGAGTQNQNGTTMATKVTPVAIMTQPKSIFYGVNNNMSKLYFLLDSGILSADSWIFNCSGCNSTSGNVVAPVSAFSTSTSTLFSYAQAVNGATDSADYIPMNILSGTRRMRSSVAISVKTTSGSILSGVSIRWSGPDAPGLLSSSSGSKLATDDMGSARAAQLPSGPINFTLSVASESVCPPTCTSGQSPTTSTTSTTVAGATPSAPAGTLSSGASLQAASVTVVVGETGLVTLTIPDPPEVVSRKISVTLPDADRTPVPNATIQLKNNYLTYAYSNSGSTTSTWSSRPKDAKGYLGQMNCAYCFVAPPKYATGVDGSVTFPSFNPSSRSSAYDADIAYDDGELNQTVKKTFASITETVQMPFMAAIKVTLPDADPATPTKEADADPTTPETDIKADSTVGVTIETDLVDEDKVPITGVSQSVEPVNSGSSCEKGGLVGSTDKVSTICANGGVSASSINKAAIVRAMRVKTSAGCSAMMVAKTGSNGKATLVICPSASTKYRIRATGAVASKTICVRVNNVPCGVSSTSVNTPINTPTYTDTPTVVVSKVAVLKKGKTTSFTTINKTSKVSVPKGAKVVLVVAVTTKRFCSISGTSVKALLPGTCVISVKVTPKATAKVKKPKTTTTKIKITIKN